MDDIIYTPDQVAKILELHPKTIRRYIREGKLKASRIGGQWRVERKDLNKFMGRESITQITESNDPIKSIHDSMDIDRPILQVSTVIDYYTTEVEATRISNSITAVMNCKDPDLTGAKFNFIYYMSEGKARFILWGKPMFISKMLQTFEEISR